MTQTGTCCTCASFLSDTKIPRDPKSEKPLTFDRHLECCHRIICAACQYKNTRFQSYCPFCQISSEPTALPQNGLRLPPAYSKTTTSKSQSNNQSPGTSLGVQFAADDEAPPPPYTPSSTTIQSTSSSSHSAALVNHNCFSPSSTTATTTTNTTASPSTNDTIHHLSPNDTLSSLSLAYSVPIPVLQSHNNLFSPHLLAARKFILIPRSHYQGPPLSSPPDPIEEARKRRIRRWMVATKCADYRVAEVYLKAVAGQQNGGDGDGEGQGQSNAGVAHASVSPNEADQEAEAEAEQDQEDSILKDAIERYKADEEWEARNPLEQQKKGKRKGGGGGGGGTLSGQLF